MKSFALIVALLSAAPAFVEAQSAEKCALVHRLATRIMEMRQAGTTMPEAMETTKELPDPAWVKLAEYLTREAYGVRRYTDSAGQEAIIGEFANNQAAVCYRVASE